jgi:hypothetical protein
LLEIINESNLNTEVREINSAQAFNNFLQNGEDSSSKILINNLLNEIEFYLIIGKKKCLVYF